MLTSLTMEGYRGFEKFTLNGLGRVNLLIGMNNSGKTSVLEAIQLLVTDADQTGLQDMMQRRGEILRYDSERSLLVKYLFSGRGSEVGSRFTISGEFNGSSHRVSMSIESIEIPPAPPYTTTLNTTVVQVRASNSKEPKYTLILGSRNEISTSELKATIKRQVEFGGFKCGIVPSESMPGEFITGIWPYLALKEEAKVVLSAIQIIEPKVNDFAVLGTGDHKKSDTLLKLSDAIEPVPIGNLGEGTWRMFALAMALASLKGGVLLIDDIDTGLHYSVMEKMWKMIAETAAKLNVQVFATTHSFDCVASLAAVCQNRPDNHNASIHRINPKYPESTCFTEQEIIQVAENRMDIR